VLLLSGIVVGAGAVVVVQERYLPPRLSAVESTELRASFEAADGERQRLKRELADATQRLQATRAENKGLSDELGATRVTSERLRKDVASLVEMLPPDPRSGEVAVRAARFTTQGGSLAYDVVLSRDKPGARPLSGVVQFVVAGEGRKDTVTSKPVTVTVGRYESVSGNVPLPEGFKPREARVSVLDRPDGKQLGTRVMYVK
jgi:hypothetical protein